MPRNRQACLFIIEQQKQIIQDMNMENILKQLQEPAFKTLLEAMQKEDDFELTEDWVQEWFYWKGKKKEEYKEYGLLDTDYKLNIKGDKFLFSSIEELKDDFIYELHKL